MLLLLLWCSRGKQRLAQLWSSCCLESQVQLGLVVAQLFGLQLLGWTAAKSGGTMVDPALPRRLWGNGV